MNVNFLVVNNSYSDSTIFNFQNSNEYPEINYNDIQSITIEQMILTGGSDDTFVPLTTFIKTDSILYGESLISDFIQGSSYVYRLVVTLNNNNNINLLNKAISVSYANPILNCGKFNNVYRKACHNCFQQNVISNLNFSQTPPFMSGIKKSLDLTRVIELDIHTPAFAFLKPGIWNVRHSPFSFNTNNNNCGITGDNNFDVCLDDVESWHNQNLGHDPIVVFIDLKSDFIANTHSAQTLDNLLIQKFGFADIYKPKDLLGSRTDISLAARENNLPSMGDLTDKFIFVLTGPTSRINQYYFNHLTNNTEGICFAAIPASSPPVAANVNGIFPIFKPNIIFFNVEDVDNLNTGLYVSSFGYMSRIWGTNLFPGFGSPSNFSNSDYEQAIDFNMNNIAVRNIWANFNPGGKPVNGFLYEPDVHFPGLVNDHIYSDYQNVTQAATQNIVASDLIVEPDAHYRMLAGNVIDLQPGVEFKAGSDVDVRIDDCTGADYNLRKATNNNPLTPEEIAALMHELDKDLYSYVPQNEEEVERLMVYPNPTNNEFTISYRNYLLNKAILTLYDIAGRTVKTKVYQPSQKGLQNFTVNVQHLKEGTYFYTLQVGNQTKNGKVIKVQ